MQNVQSGLIHLIVRHSRQRILQRFWDLQGGKVGGNRKRFFAEFRHAIDMQTNPRLLFSTRPFHLSILTGFTFTRLTGFESSNVINM